MLKYALLLGVVTIAAGSYYFWSLTVPATTEEITTLSDGKVPEEAGGSASDIGIEVPDATTADPDMKVYRNTEFGFEFEYPRDWEIRAPAFYSKVSLLNMSISPDGSDAVVINITPKEWVENALVKMRARGVNIEDVTLDGHAAIELKDKDRVSRPATITLVLVDDTFWIDITGVLGYEEGYRQILNSFKLPK